MSVCVLELAKLTKPEVSISELALSASLYGIGTIILNAAGPSTRRVVPSAIQVPALTGMTAHCTRLTEAPCSYNVAVRPGGNTVTFGAGVDPTNPLGKSLPIGLATSRGVAEYDDLKGKGRFPIPKNFVPPTKLSPPSESNSML